MPTSPAPFGRYLLLDKVAAGGMAEVWRGKLIGESGFERIVAIKKILPHVSDNEQFITMFTDEAKITVQLQHANIGQVYEFSKHDGTYFIGMEYVSGKDLKTIWKYHRKRKKIMPVELACKVVQMMCEGLDYAHRKKDNYGKSLGIVHRDVSPQNVIVSWDGEVKVIDFGIAKAADKGGKTRAGTLKGKFAYMSPEQIRGRPLDGRADVFSLGVVLYELVTGERGFEAESEFALLEKVRDVQITPPTMLNPDLPQAIEKIIFGALEKDRTQRFQHASELSEALQRFMLKNDTTPSRDALGQYLRQNFTVDFDQERLRLESYKEIQWEDAKETTRRPKAPRTTDSGPQRFSDIQRALGDEVSVTDETKISNPSESNSGPFAPMGSTKPAPAAPPKKEVTPVTAALPRPPPTAAQQTGRSPMGLYAAAAAGVLFTAFIIIAGVVFLTGKDVGILTITIDGPSSAKVIVDGESRGSASPSLTVSELEAGTRDIIVEAKGFRSYHKRVKITAGTSVDVTAKLEHAPGSFSISSVPPGADIFLDGKQMKKKTPAVVPAEVGLLHQIDVALAGYARKSESKKLSDAKTVDVHMVLEKVDE